MCGMCGLLGGGNHWSNTTAPVAGANPRRQRLIQAALANRVLVPLRLKLDDFHGQSFLLSSPTGASELVSDFSQVWRVAERMLGRPLDPLTLFTDIGNDKAAP
ncbi:MAG: hypothetical protein M3O74_21355 [Pseudomonadota bacterium]|jgi:hypothetical protein|uniref:Uncharacterized protein n=1 Tax=Caballeronia sordidicola TaxID=196367 RepID=A0A242MIS4_CABSO|nr:MULTISPECIES: hypothetical protein [Burkholderiaceae]AMM16588.1 hypothetical protein AX768_21040 [Burkholderia sp. PAMC 28687]MDP9156783.1 hypothetical protein [Pseudomonadota bacterium]OTP70858.1 hypothetical protein PAMC26510_24845 [Caballeronia sordidicola]